MRLRIIKEFKEQKISPIYKKSALSFVCPANSIAHICSTHPPHPQQKALTKIALNM